jgi:hypothetical protein
MEPTDQRQIRRLGFTADQLLRRPIPGGEDSGETGQWCRIWLDAGQTCPAGTRSVVEFDQAVNNYPTYFTAVPFPGGGVRGRIEILQEGYYVATYRIHPGFSGGQSPDAPFSTELHGVDYDTFLGYSHIQDAAAQPEESYHDSYGFQSAPWFGDEPPQVFVIVNLNNPAITDDMIIDTNRGNTGVYLDVTRVSDMVSVDMIYPP